MSKPKVQTTSVAVAGDTLNERRRELLKFHAKVTGKSLEEVSDMYYGRSNERLFINHFYMDVEKYLARTEPTNKPKGK